jgi:hypothetical protein
MRSSITWRCRKPPPASQSSRWHSCARRNSSWLPLEKTGSDSSWSFFLVCKFQLIILYHLYLHSFFCAVQTNFYFGRFTPCLYFFVIQKKFFFSGKKLWLIFFFISALSCDVPIVGLAKALIPLLYQFTSVVAVEQTPCTVHLGDTADLPQLEGN